MTIESNFATLDGLSCTIIEERSVALLEELSVHEAISAIEEFCNRYRWASHKIHRSISGYFRGVCKKYWKINREAHKLQLCASSSCGTETAESKAMIIDAVVNLLFTKASGLSKELLDIPKRNMLLSFSSYDAIEALYEFCNAAMYREHKIRNMNAYLLNIIKRRQAVRQVRGRGAKPRRSSHRLDDNRPHVGESPSTPTNRRRIRESLADTANALGMEQMKRRGKIGYRIPLPYPNPGHSPDPRIKDESVLTPKSNGFITPPGSSGYKDDLKNKTNSDSRATAMEGICVGKSTSPDRSLWSRNKVKNFRKDKSLSVFCRKKKPTEMSFLSPTFSMTTELEMSQSEPLDSSLFSTSPRSTEEEELPCKFSPENSPGEKKTCQAYTIHNLPILMDHYIVSTLSEYIFSC